MKKIIVTGATGFIGGALTKKLLLQGERVYGIDINAKRLEEMKQYGDFVPVVADFSKYDVLDEFIGESGFDVFYHFAWQGVFGDSFKDYRLQLNNAAFAADALMVAKKLDCKKFVLAGTYNEYETENFMRSETFTPRYTCIYSTSKMAAELVCKTLAFQNGIEYSAGRICMAYGEGNRSKMLANVVIGQLINKQNPKLIEGNNYYDMIYIDDITDAFIAIAEKGHNLKSYYVGHRTLKTFRELFTEIRDILCPEAKLGFGEYKDTVNMDYSLIDTEALYRDTDFECRTDFRGSIVKTAEWVKTLGWEA